MGCADAHVDRALYVQYRHQCAWHTGGCMYASLDSERMSSVRTGEGSGGAVRRSASGGKGGVGHADAHVDRVLPVQVAHGRVHHGRWLPALASGVKAV